MRLKDKTAIITGSASGMGRVAAELFASEGAAIVVTDVNEAAGEETVAAIHKAGGQAIFIKADVSNESEVKALVDAAIESFGRVDVLYNNAGIMPDSDTSVVDTSADTWDRV